MLWCQEAIYRARMKREARTKPQPWIVLKFVVGITIGIIGYTSYVYIGRLCVPMLLEEANIFGKQAMGIGFLVVFSLLLFMISWSYVKIIFTSPGYANQYISKSPPPPASKAPPRPVSFESDDIGRGEYQPTPQEHSRVNSHSPRQSTTTTQVSEKHTSATRCDSGIQPPATSHQPTRQGHALSDEPQPLDARPAQARLAFTGTDLELGNAAKPLPGNAKFDPWLTRRPPEKPVLRPETRYCFTDGFVKPVRAHHCRACGTCVLKYDHHCPWIGQCVGARNHKFFLNFTTWAALYCIWIFATLLPTVVYEGRSLNSNIDIQKVVVVALAGMFGLFTVVLTVSHTYLICMNQSTVETFGAKGMKEREEMTLAKLHPWCAIGAKRRTRKRWDAEWGRIGMEGNIWWLGSKRANWEAVMGKSVWWWFLPIGHSEGDGLTFPVNPRFSEDGVWMPKRDWPPELQ